VILDRWYGKLQFTAYRFVALALHHEHQNVELAVRQVDIRRLRFRFFANQNFARYVYAAGKHELQSVFQNLTFFGL